MSEDKLEGWHLDTRSTFSSSTSKSEDYYVRGHVRGWVLRVGKKWFASVHTLPDSLDMSGESEAKAWVEAAVALHGGAE